MRAAKHKQRTEATMVRTAFLGTGHYVPEKVMRAFATASGRATVAVDVDVTLRMICGLHRDLVYETYCDRSAAVASHLQARKRTRTNRRSARTAAARLLMLPAPVPVRSRHDDEP